MPGPRIKKPWPKNAQSLNMDNEKIINLYVLYHKAQGAPEHWLKRFRKAMIEEVERKKRNNPNYKLHPPPDLPPAELPTPTSSTQCAWIKN